jgi:hypothetical protein
LQTIPKAELLQDATDAIAVAKALYGNGDFSKCPQFLRLLQDPNIGFQEKHNGDRRIIEKRGNLIYDYNRNGGSGKGLPSHVIEALRRHPLHQFIIDVELVKNRHFDGIYVFDALFLGDEGVVGMPYCYRESSYHAQFDGFDECIAPVETARTTEEKMKLIVRLRGENAEGFVTKDLRAVYRPSDGNRRYNFRYKFVKNCDCVVIGDSTKRVDGHLRDSVRLGLFGKRGKLKDICGATKKSAFTLKAGDVVEIAYLYASGNLDVVQPRILRQRFDKRPEECTLDQLVVNKNWRSST